MSAEQHIPDNFTKILIRSQVGIALLLLLLALSASDFLFPSEYKLKAGIHGVSAILAVVVGTFLTHLALPLIKGMQVRLANTLISFVYFVIFVDY